MWKPFNTQWMSGFAAAPEPRVFQRGAAAAAVPRRILIVTDAWTPQVNGVVRTICTTGRELAKLGHEIRFASPENHTTIALPTYPEIRLAVYPRPTLAELFDTFSPQAVHIATEGTMGFAARSLCLERGFPFTTAFHTRFPDYINARFPFISKTVVFRALQSFHAPASATMVSTPSLKAELGGYGFNNIALWSRGVDTDVFKPGARDGFEKLGVNLPRPVFLTVGRIAVEKNIESFLSLDLPGSKAVIGEGPEREALQRRFPKAHFLGARYGEELASLYRSADVFVFPSRTDTFGLVMLEALASGVPVAAFPVPGPLDVVGDAPVAVLNDNLTGACLDALAIKAAHARNYALTRSWRASSEEFLSNLAIVA